MKDSDLIFQMLHREIDNLLARINNPLLFMFSEPIKMYVDQLISPYISAFTNKTNGELDANMASEFVKTEINNKVEAFKKNFEEMKDI